MRTLYIIAGCNGAGKTTASYTMLPDILNCKEFVNADSIAAGLSPFQPEKVAFQAGRVMLQRIGELISEEATFAFETTLSTISYKETIKLCKAKGYRIVLLYFWLSSPELAIERIKRRVEKGGHHIPDNIVKRRYKRGLENFFTIFQPLCDYWELLDNSGNLPNSIAAGEQKFEKSIYNAELWHRIRIRKNGK
ncbi:MAG TPA: zeta toxin family protein [Bacteroidia bacterium]|jgi:predicted ABC-type ATPase|nr:zeta toxin family protein [Bacteroidia bacterium]